MRSVLYGQPLRLVILPWVCLTAWACTPQWRGTAGSGLAARVPNPVAKQGTSPASPQTTDRDTTQEAAAVPAHDPVPTPIEIERAAEQATASPVPSPEVEDGTPDRPRYTGEKISLDFNGADIHDVLRVLADVSGLNIVTTDDVQGRLTLRLVDVPWDQALAVVLRAHGLEQVESGNVVTISTPARLETERRARLRAREAELKLAAFETAYVKINYVKATDIVDLIRREHGPSESAGRDGRRSEGTGSRSRLNGAADTDAQVALMSPGGTIAADDTANVVVVRDVPDNIAAVRELIRHVDIQMPQVLIESYIVTANGNVSRSLGIQWGYQYTAGPDTGNPTGVNFPGRIGIGGAPLRQGETGGTQGVPFIADFPARAAGAATLDLFLGSVGGSSKLNMRLSALESEGRARVISRPRVVTLNNGDALIELRREVRVPVTAGNLTVGGAGTRGGGEAFEEFDVGIRLKVSPQISSDGFVLLDIEAESSELTDSSVTTTAASSTVPNIPDVLSRTTNSQVLIRAGATFVLGGILQDNLDRRESGIPYLRHVPGLGWLFKGKTDRRTKDELMIFLTPRIVAGVSTAGLPSSGQLWKSRPQAEAES